MKRHRTFLLPLLLAAACQPRDHKEQQPHAHGDVTPGEEHERGLAHRLGTVTIGEFTFEVLRFGDLFAGAEADFDLGFPAGHTRPEALRAWIGRESAMGSMKTRFANEDQTIMHGHVLAPSPLPTDARLWIEIETAKVPRRGSLPPR